MFCKLLREKDKIEIRSTYFRYAKFLLQLLNMDQKY